MRVLITGITGFAGSYLADALKNDPSVMLFGVARQPANLLPELHGQVHCFMGDLLSTEFVQTVLREVQPEVVYHLAGQASVAAAWSQPWQTMQTNLQPQLNLLEGLISLQMSPHFLSVTSSKVYGDITAAEMPLTEETPLCPDNPYGVSKAAQDLMAQQYHLSHRLPIIRVRPFNHIGPRQSDDFVTAAFARQIAMIEAGLLPPVVRVGNLTAQRDFTDVRDIVRGYIRLIEAGQPGEVYNLGSGRAVAIEQILTTLLDFSQIDIQVEQDPARMRPVDQPISYGAIDKIEQQLGWQPQIDLKTSLQEMNRGGTAS